MSDYTMTVRSINVEHVRIESKNKAFADTRTALEYILPRLDPMIIELLRQGDQDRVRERQEHGPALSIFLIRDHGELLEIVGKSRKAIQYEIGNPITASRMTRHQLAAGLYAPLRVVLYENEEGMGVFEYDRPSTVFAQFGDSEVTLVARGLDESLAEALLKAVS